MRSLALLFLLVTVAYSASSHERHESMEAITGQPPANGSEPGFIKGVWNKFTSGVHNGIEKIEGLFHHSNSTEHHEAPPAGHLEHSNQPGANLTPPLP